MINIGICDDDQRFLNELALKINNLNIVDSESLQVEKFISGENLIFELEENPNRFSILIVDIVMNGINGIEVSKILRRYGYDGIIIFLTSSKEYALESFEVFPMAYILKENIDNVFEEILLKAIKNLKVNTVKKIAISDKETEKTINVSTIIYIESLNKKIILHKSSNENEEIKGSLKFIYEKIKEYGFIRCHKSYIINAKYIHSFNCTNCTLKNNYVIPIGRKFSEEFKERFLTYEFDNIIL
ncbi:MAG: LytR/AlgR family response regulator transcription factor [Clostridium perfringens]|uniref:LytR/AlgR family response regulator transcription factor n=2 Tax=Clostridium perfringens TaxID=1502 RepID=UPI000DF0EAFC|nr:LytTR family DNA-binding domain-containing protein [Clostridium perfringens]QDB01021.1 hypothetical protein [Clostridium perfringens]STB42093.1 LytTR family two component transcriptional regulator [Clostridium perfringens]